MEYEKTKKIWLNFHANGVIDDDVPENIAASWIRSRKAGVDPFDIDHEKIMYSSEQRQGSINKNKWIIKLVEPVMKELHQQFNQQNLTISLVDENLYVLNIIESDEAKSHNLLNRHIKLGMCLSEDNVGTTAFSLCLNSRKSETVIGYEHYCKECSDLFCTAVPIFDDTNKIIALLGIATTLENKYSEFNSLLLIISIMIESNIKMYKENKVLEKQSYLFSLLIDASSDGILSVDMDGIITFINPAGMKILNIDKPVVGKHITKGVDFEPTILEVLKTHKGYVDKEFRLQSKRGIIHFVKTAIPLKDEYGEMIGVLDIFRSINDVKSMVNRMTGAQAKYAITNITGESNEIHEVKKMVKFAGSNDSHVLIHGEVGTGKEIIAQAIHNSGSRREGPFIAINCATLPRNLIDSELFGYEDGSFTGESKGGRPGKFELAYGGTLFIEEVGNMPLDIQGKFLKVLKQKSVVRIGGFREIPIDVRIIVTTHKDLTEMIKEKNFRDDIYNRLNVINIAAPALRGRHDDLDLIIDQMIKQHNMINGTNKKISDEARNMLHDWDWPGNVRELENEVEYAYYLADGTVILPEHLQSKIADGILEKDKNHLITLKEAESIAIKKAIDHTGGNITQSAKILGIGRNTLYGKIKEYGLQ